MHIVTIVMWWGKHYLEIEWSAQSHSSISQIFLNLALPGWMQSGMAEQSKCQDENRIRLKAIAPDLNPSTTFIWCSYECSCDFEMPNGHDVESQHNLLDWNESISPRLALLASVSRTYLSSQLQTDKKQVNCQVKSLFVHNLRGWVKRCDYDCMFESEGAKLLTGRN